MGVWITIGIFLFVVGSVFALKPSAKDKTLGNLRQRARVLGLQPKVVACPEWLINKYGKKGEGMVARYGLVLPDATLPACNALVIDGMITVIEGDITLNHEVCAIDDALGLTMQANFISLYIKESVYGVEQNRVENIDKRINNIKENLQKWAEKVQA